MPKPYGLSMFPLAVVHPDRWMDEVWDAVETARASGADVDDVLKEVRSAWAHSCEEEAKRVWTGSR